MKQMRQFLKTAGILALVCFVSALLLSTFDSLTRDSIALTTQKKKEAARALVLPAARYTAGSFLPVDAPNEVLGELLGNALPGTRSLVSTNYVLARDEAGETAGYIFDVVSPGGYGGDIDLVVGVAFRPDGAWGSARISDYIVISSAETPGLGKSVEQNLHAYFTNRPLLDRKGVFDIDPADSRIDSISGATITSLAIKDALAAALQAASLIMKRDWVKLDLPPELLSIIPYAQSFERILRFPEGEVRELLDARWYGQTSGYLVKIFLQEAGQKRIGLAGFVLGDTRLYAARLFLMPEKAGGDFVQDASFRAPLFYGRELSSWHTNAMLTDLESNFARAAFRGHELLRKEGKLP